MRAFSIACMLLAMLRGVASAQDTAVPVNALPVSPAQSDPDHPAGAPNPDASANQAAPLDDEGDSAPTPPLKGKLDPRAQSVRAELAKVTAEREHSSNLLPWLTLSTGIAATALGTIAGSAYALGCSHECSTHPWVSVVVVAGAAVSVLGTIWVLRIDHDIAEIDSRKYMLERELEHFDQTRLRDSRLYAHADPVWTLHF